MTIPAPASHTLPCIAIAGPTASGKTAAALALAHHVARRGLRCEIISVDSALVYRHMDIGAAKPSAAERASVPHHLIDIRDPTQTYSAAEFVHDATRCIRDIRARGALPLLVGGTMLYFKALRDGLDDMPPADAQVRAALDAQAAVDGWAALHAQLARIDPVTAARLAPGDSQRIQRALEVWTISGRPLSSFHTRHTPASAASAAPAPRTTGRHEPNHLDIGAFFSLEPQERAWLHQRIAQRFDLMLEQGFMHEMHTLRGRGDLHVQLPSMRCVGYRQAWDMLDNPTTMDMDVLRQRAGAATRQLAKRQLTWLRSMPQRHTIACDAPDAQAQLLHAVSAYLLSSQ